MVKSLKIVGKLNLRFHQEVKVDISVSTSIYLLLLSGSVSRLHRIPMAETGHFYLGEPITVVELHDDGKLKLICLGPDLREGDHKLQYTALSNIWVGSYPIKDVHLSHDATLHKAEPRNSKDYFSLVGCTCDPTFQFEDFELGKRSELSSRFPQYESLITMLSYPETKIDALVF